MSLNETKSAVANVTKFLTAFRTGRGFAALWQDCLGRLSDLDVKEPQTPRVIRPPKKTDAASDTVHSFSSAEEFYRQGYYEIIDALITQIGVRFDQKTFKLYQSIENLILAAATQQERLNSIATLHTHHDHSSGIDLRNVGNIFILKNSKRKDTFGIF